MHCEARKLHLTAPPKWMTEISPHFSSFLCALCVKSFYPYFRRPRYQISYKPNCPSREELIAKGDARARMQKCLRRAA